LVVASGGYERERDLTEHSASSDREAMTRFRFAVVVVVFLGVWLLEISADLHPYTHVSWSHAQARDTGGVVVLAAVIWAFVRPWP
jgi:hypothetical protein